MSPFAWQLAWQLNTATGKPFDEIIDDLRPFFPPNAFMSHENGVKMLEALGEDQTRTHRNAYELKAQNADVS